jgi:hypothetical protein
MGTTNRCDNKQMANRNWGMMYHRRNSVLNDIDIDIIVPPSKPQTTNDLNYGAGRSIVVVHIAEKPSIGMLLQSLSCMVLLRVSKNDGIV